MESIIVSDIFGYRYQVIWRKEKHAVFGREIIFSDAQFAEQFVRWLQMDERCCVLVLELIGFDHHSVGQTWREIAEELVKGSIRIFKLEMNEKISEG